MKFSLILLFSVLALSCYAMDTDMKPHSEPVKKNLKRSLSENSKKLIDKEDSKKRVVQSSEDNDKNEKNFKLMPEINKKLLYKAAILIEVLPSVSESLHKIREELRGKAVVSKEQNFVRATELAGLGTSALSIDKSVSLILNNLIPFSKSSKAENSLLNASLAIIGSGALNNHINNFVKILSAHEDTKEINCEILKISYDKIQEVLNDVEINKLVLED